MNVEISRRIGPCLSIFSWIILYAIGLGPVFGYPVFWNDPAVSRTMPANSSSFSKTIPPGFSLISNPLFHNRGVNMAHAVSDNTVGEVLKPVPEGTVLCKFNHDTQQYSQNVFSGGHWANPRQTLLPGEGAFILNPSQRSFVIVFNGNWRYGGSAFIPAGISLMSSPEWRPIDFGPVLILVPPDFLPTFFPHDGDVVCTFDPAYGRLRAHHFQHGTWDSVPVVGVGEAFFVITAYPRFVNFNFYEYDVPL